MSDNKAKLFTWEPGKEGVGYSRMLLFKLFNIDCWLFKMPKGSKISCHFDKVAKGYEHHRINVILKRAKDGGRGGALDSGGYKPLFSRVHRFRPDIQWHWIDKVHEGTMYFLSIGFLRKGAQKGEADS